jgi:predicted NAD/FAD-binding protein
VSHAATDRIAVVGSGLAGLAAAWLLGREREVVLHESFPTGGMGAHSVHVAGHTDRSLIDVPLRVFTPSYYPTLMALYAHVGIETAPVDYAASFSTLGADTYFRYFNVRVAGRSIPMLDPSVALRGAAQRITADLLRLHRRGPRDLQQGRLRGVTLGEYLAAERYSSDFVDGFVLPAYASICTCRTDSVRGYPAETIVAYMCSGVATSGVRRAVNGTDEIMRRLSATAANVRFGAPVRRITPDRTGVEVLVADGESARYAHVVLATRADQGAALLAQDDALASLLRRVPHESSRVVVHRDPRLAPANRRQWSSVNFVSSTSHDSPMATIWLNRVQPALRDAAPIFQTWNPIVEPAPESIVTEAMVARPLVTLDTATLPHELAQLHNDPARRVWPAGSYVERGVPLLESAAASALRVTRRLGVSIPFAVPA